MRALKIAVGALVACALLALLVLWQRPPALLRVGANYAAKIVCSNVFLAHRDADAVLQSDVQAPGVFLLRLMRVSVDRERGVVRAALLGFIAEGAAVATPGAGCAVILDKLAGALPKPGGLEPAAAPVRDDATLWPDGSGVATVPAINRLIADDALAGPGARAIVVIDHGRIVAEHYAEGFTADTPLLGWSMSKTVLAGLIGMLIKDGTLALDQAGFWPRVTGDGRDRIRIADLLAMVSGLRFNEAYGAVSDVTDMLYLRADMAAFARSQPLAHPVGDVWSYSSGTALILSRILQDAAAEDGAAFVRRRLFRPLGMTSATMEADAHGTLVGSSYMYATARDWARYAQFLLQDGVWQGAALLPAGYVDMMATPVAASGGQYGHGMVWLWGSDGVTPGVNPDAAFGIPDDTFWLSGHDGQSIAVIRSRQLILVRLGLTPHSDHYSPQALLQAVLTAMPVNSPAPHTT